MRAFVAVLPPQPAVEDLSDFLTPRREASGAGAPAPRWTRDEHLHLTLAFLPEVADRDLDELVERLGEAAAARSVGPMRLAGGGAFPDAAFARVLWVGVEPADVAAGPGVSARQGASAGPDVSAGLGASAGPDVSAGTGVAAGLGALAGPDVVAGSDVFAGMDVSEELTRLAGGVRSAAGRAGVVVEGGPFRPHVTVARMGRAQEATRWLRVLQTYRGPRWQPDEVALIASHLGQGPRRTPRYEVLETFALARG